MVSGILRRELIRKFRVLGYTGPFSGGKHQFMIKGRQKIRIPNPHRGEEIDVSLLKEIRRQADIRDDNWERA